MSEWPLLALATPHRQSASEPHAGNLACKGEQGPWQSKCRGPRWYVRWAASAAELQARAGESRYAGTATCWVQAACRTTPYML